MKPTAVVIGAGIGGIAAAAHLARRGFHVTVFEKNQRPGGRCDHFTQEGHRFDTGPTLLVMPLVYEAEFAALGTSLREKLELLRVDPTYHLVFDDGSQIALTSDMKLMHEQLEALEPGSFEGFLRYMQEGEQHYRLAMERMVERDFRTASAFLSFSNIPLVFQIKALLPHYRHVSTLFTHPHLRAAFTFQDVYMGLSPFEAPATFSMMPYTELAHGVWYPKGGMSDVVAVLVDIACDAGVEFVYETTVERIETAGSRACGVLLEGGRYQTADVVIANADLPYVYRELLPDEDAADSLERKSYSCSVVSFFWGVDRTYPSLAPHMLFLAEDYRENFRSIGRDLTLPENPSLYIHAPTRLDPTCAPPEQDTLIAIVPVGHLDETGKQDWKSLRNKAREAVFRRLALTGITNLESHLKFEVNYTPLSWRKRYNLMKGATHGLAHTLNQLGYFRPHNRHSRYHNLYFVGASTHPGTGVPTALISAHQVADRVVDDLFSDVRLARRLPTKTEGN
jgi:phytoene desaturase